MSEAKRCTGNDCLVDTYGMRDGKPLCNECWEKTITEAQKPEAVLSNSTVLLCCPWDKLEKEEDGDYNNFAAWGRWMDEKSEAILDGMDITHETDLYGIMIDLLKAT